MFVVHTIYLYDTKCTIGTDIIWSYNGNRAQEVLLQYYDYCTNNIFKWAYMIFKMREDRAYAPMHVMNSVYWIQFYVGINWNHFLALNGTEWDCSTTNLAGWGSSRCLSVTPSLSLPVPLAVNRMVHQTRRMQQKCQSCWDWIKHLNWRIPTTNDP